jgi:hypothetical protein
MQFTENLTLVVGVCRVAFINQICVEANAIADCLEKQFTPHKLCDENHERQGEA